MPTWTSQVIHNDPNVFAQRQQNLNNLVNSMGQFANVIYGIQQAKQAESIKKISVVAELGKLIPKSRQPQFLVDNLTIPLKDLGIDLDLSKVNFDTSKETIDSLGNIFKLPTNKQLPALIALKNTGILTNEDLTAIQKQNEQARIIENLGIVQGLPTTTTTPVPLALEPGMSKFAPEFAGGFETTKTTTPTSRERLDALNAMRATKEGRDAITGLTPKEKTGGHWTQDKFGKWQYLEKGETLEGAIPTTEKPTMIKMYKKLGKEVEHIEVPMVEYEERKKQGYKLGTLSYEPKGPAPERPEKLTMTDVKSAYSMDIGNIKNRMMVEMTPDEQTNVSGQPAENILALIMSGKIGKSLSPEKKAGYIKELRKVESYYGDLTNQVLGRKGATVLDKGGAVKPEGGQAEYEKTMQDAREAVMAIKKAWGTGEQAKKAIKGIKDNMRKKGYTEKQFQTPYFKRLFGN